MRYKGAAIEINGSCYLQCKHCCQNYNTSSKTKKMSTDSFSYIMSILKKNNDIKYVSLSGGEPFQDVDDLFSKLKTAKNFGFSISTVTSCIWANTPKYANEIVEELKNQKIDQLVISSDKFHQEFVSITNVYNVLNATRKHKLNTIIQIAIDNNSDIGVTLNPLRDVLDGVGLLIFPVYPAGRAIKKLENECFIRSQHYLHQFCEAGNSLEIRYDGSIFPCCSPMATETQFNLCNVFEEDIDQIWAKVYGNPILFIIWKYGFDPFINFARTELGISFPDRLVSSCEICASLFSPNYYFKCFIFALKLISNMEQNA